MLENVFVELIKRANEKRKKIVIIVIVLNHSLINVKRTVILLE